MIKLPYEVGLMGCIYNSAQLDNETLPITPVQAARLAEHTLVLQQLLTRFQEVQRIYMPGLQKYIIFGSL